MGVFLEPKKLKWVDLSLCFCADIYYFKINLVLLLDLRIERTKTCSLFFLQRYKILKKVVTSWEFFLQVWLRGVHEKKKIKFTFS